MNEDQIKELQANVRASIERREKRLADPTYQRLLFLIQARSDLDYILGLLHDAKCPCCGKPMRYNVKLTCCQDMTIDEAFVRVKKELDPDAKDYAYTCPKCGYQADSYTTTRCYKHCIKCNAKIERR